MAFDCKLIRASTRLLHLLPLHTNTSFFLSFFSRLDLQFFDDLMVYTVSMVESTRDTQGAFISVFALDNN